MTGSQAGLQPFRKGDPRTIAAARKGVEARQAATASRVKRDRDALRALRTVADKVDRDELGTLALAAAVDIMGKVVAGTVKVRDPAAWVRVLVDIARAEEGLPTSTSVVAHVGTDAVARALALRDEARAALAYVVDTDSAQTGTSAQLDTETPTDS